LHTGDRDLFGDDPPPLAVAKATPPDPPRLPLPDANSSDAARDAYSAEAFAIWKSTCPRCAFCDRDFVERDTAWKSNLQPDFNVSAFDSFDARPSSVLRELGESNRFVQRSAESTSI
jgi:hypothetical protein